MKKKTLAAILIVFMITTSFKNGRKIFTIIGSNANREIISSHGKLDISQIKFINKADTALQFNWNTVENSFPENWEYSMCAYGKCQIGIPKSGITKFVQPGDTGFIAIHVFPLENCGKGRVTFELSPERYSKQTELIKFEVEAQ